MQIICSTGVDVSNDDIFPKFGLRPYRARKNPAVLFHAHELPRSRRVQLVPSIGKHRYDSGMLCEKEEIIKSMSNGGGGGNEILEIASLEISAASSSSRLAAKPLI